MKYFLRYKENLMDTKMKIIFAVFVLVIIFYFMQFMLEFMKKKEHFSNRYFDDVEHYEDAPSKPAATPDVMKPYEVRLFLLDEIDKLNITDKSAKGALMETLFSEATMKEFDNLSDSKESRDKLSAKVKSVYESVKAPSVAAAPVVAAPLTAPKTESAEAPKQVAAADASAPAKFENAPEKTDGFEHKMKAFFANNEVGSATLDLKSKVNKASEKLDVVIDNLQDMKQLLSDSAASKESYVPSPPSLSSIAPLLKKQELIEGFESIRSYATY